MNKTGNTNFVVDQSAEDQNVSDSLCTKDRNIRDASGFAKYVADLTVNSSMKEHTKIDIGKDNKPFLDEAILKRLQDVDALELTDKQEKDMTQAERVVYTIWNMNQGVNKLDQFVNGMKAAQEKDFLNAYSGHMGMVMRELRNFKQKINSEKFEMKKNA